ncbi:hypothetical protein EJ05DRAFT_508001 [Pseudovirgaria hyperparasitica]|uniref:Uncharacterized protein n=1 Tax=Pseudovirgaria hyperparasitica TaxID=470096 RepID=A0A6A6WDU7_9PEZI|nr:uncharacterized protein EJ05DRAFT_508001 [Pseudovirgaria hyperparasitica]KAF2760745.1 hypothetical protein EJ05DRAFT_508001 [Pseudovirgaria hyperparasitica]
MPMRQPQPAANGPLNAGTTQRNTVKVPDSGVKLSDTASSPSVPAQNLSQTATKPRRKPRKLNRDAATKATPNDLSNVLNDEILTLKARVRELEAQVEALYSRPSESSIPAKLPRRRGRGRPIPGSEEAVKKLEAELEAVRTELVELKHRADEDPGKSSAAGIDDAEDVPCASEPVVEELIAGPGKAVTLTGNYRIPLPANISLDDVRTIQSGINSANKIARGIVDSRREQRSRSNQNTESSGGMNEHTENKSWGEWIGGYSMSIAKFVKNIEADAAVEQDPTKRPVTGARRRTVPVIEQELSTAPKQAERPKRPPARPQFSGGSSGRLSQQQVETLLA